MCDARVPTTPGPVAVAALTGRWDGSGSVVRCSEYRWRSITSSLYHVVLSGEEGVNMSWPVKYPFLQFVDTQRRLLIRVLGAHISNVIL